jgi:hypothetical protein
MSGAKLIGVGCTISGSVDFLLSAWKRRRGYSGGRIKSYFLRFCLVGNKRRRDFHPCFPALYLRYLFLSFLASFVFLSLVFSSPSFLCILGRGPDSNTILRAQRSTWHVPFLRIS